MRRLIWLRIVSRPNFTGFQIKLLILLDTTHLCSHNISLNFILDVDGGSGFSLAERMQRCECGCVLDRDVAAAMVVHFRASVSGPVWACLRSPSREGDPVRQRT